MKQSYFTLFAFCSFVISQAISASAQNYSISAARAAGAGATVTVKGIIINGSELGVIRYIEDKNAGLALYSSSMSGVNPGDSIEATGTLSAYDDLLEMDPVSSFKVISTGNTAPNPIVLPLQTAFSLAYEGMLVEIAGATFGGTGSFANKATYNITQNGNSGEVYVNTTSSLIGSNIPAGKINVIGIMGVYNKDYQLLPRFLSDIVQSGPVLLSDLVQTNITNTSFTSGFQSQKNGTTTLKYGLNPNLELTPVSDNHFVTAHSINLTGLTAATFYYVQGIAIDSSGDSAKSAVELFSTASLSTGRMSIFFNNPVDTTVALYHSYAKYVPYPDDSIVKYINKAKFSLDIAMYNFDNDLTADVIGAINNAYANGVQVRMIVDGSSTNSAVGYLNNHINVVHSPTTSQYTIMHNKFMVIDASYPDPTVPYVWTGSMNWTQEQVYQDFNNIITIQDQTLAKAYTLEFNEMWGSTTSIPNTANAKFGKFKADVVPHKFMINGNLVELYFSPSDGTTAHIINSINTAQKEFYFNIYQFTRTDIATAIATQSTKNQVFAAGTIGDTTDGTPAYQIVRNAIGNKVEVYTGTLLFHHKYGIVDPHEPSDDPQVITGSHNWTTDAEESNDENTIIVHNANVANLYYQEWVKRYRENGGTETYAYTSGIEPASRTSNDMELLHYTWDGSGVQAALQSDFSSNATVDIVDMRGRVVYKGNINIPAGGSTINLNTTVLSNGMYLLNVYDSKGCSSFKLMKMQ